MASAAEDKLRRLLAQRGCEPDDGFLPDGDDEGLVVAGDLTADLEGEGAEAVTGLVNVALEGLASHHAEPTNQHPIETAAAHRPRGALGAAASSEAAKTMGRSARKFVQAVLPVRARANDASDADRSGSSIHERPQAHPTRHSPRSWPVRSACRFGWMFTFSVAVYNLVRLRTLRAVAA
jgi:hypothetical protein